MFVGIDGEILIFKDEKSTRQLVLLSVPVDNSSVLQPPSSYTIEFYISAETLCYHSSPING